MSLLQLRLMLMLLLLLLASSVAPTANTLTFLSGAKSRPKESISTQKTPRSIAEKLSGRAKFAIDWLFHITERREEEEEEKEEKLLDGLN